MSIKRPWTIKKKVLPQNADHAGVLWHGSYLNWLEEARIDALTKAGRDYSILINDGFELPVIEINIKYLSPIFIGEEITINSYFNFNEKSPKIKVTSKLVKNDKSICTKAEILLVLINKENFKVLRKKPDYLINSFRKLNVGPDLSLT